MNCEIVQVSEGRTVDFGSLSTGDWFICNNDDCIYQKSYGTYCNAIGFGENYSDYFVKLVQPDTQVQPVKIEHIRIEYKKL